MATPEQVVQLRLMIGESLVDGNESDTLFSDPEIGLLIDGAFGDVERAAYDGWRAKAAQFASLVDVVDGAASRSMSDLLKNALDMTKAYSKSSTGPTEGRTRIGRIVRPR